MSKEFVNSKFFKRRELLDGEEVYSLHFSGPGEPQGKEESYAFPAIPELGGEPYHKVLLECTCNLLKVAAENTSLTHKSTANRITQANLHEELVVFMREIGCLLQYMSNCTSWQGGKLIEYDYIEITSRLKMLDNLMAHWKRIDEYEDKN